MKTLSVVLLLALVSGSVFADRNSQAKKNGEKNTEIRNTNYEKMMSGLIENQATLMNDLDCLKSGILSVAPTASIIEEYGTGIINYLIPDMEKASENNLKGVMAGDFKFNHYVQNCVISSYQYLQGQIKLLKDYRSTHKTEVYSGDAKIMWKGLKIKGGKFYNNMLDSIKVGQ